jgi:phosphomannomutase
VVDVMYGPARGYLDRLLQEAGCDVTLLHGTRDVMFGNHPPEPAEENLGELIRTVRDRDAHLGLATDGDADRFGVVDQDGTVLAPNPILALVLRHLLGHRGWRGGVGRSVATTHLLDALASRHGVELHETPVGFKYLGDLITHGRAMFGGEESGGMSLKDHPPEKDGILACLLAAEVAAVEGVALGAVLERLYGEVGRLLSIRVNVPLSDAVRHALPARIADPPRTLGGRAVKRVQTTDGLKLHLDGGAWVLVRPSGTEPVARLYVEAPDGATLDALRDTALHHFFS